MLASNKFAERAGYNRDILAEELKELADMLPEINLDVEITGFQLGEIEVLLDEFGEEKPQPEEFVPPTAGPTVTRFGDGWQLDRHRVLSGDARDPAHYARLMQNEQAAMVFTDPPWNVRVFGHVQGRGRHKHAEFAFASGEIGGRIPCLSKDYAWGRRRGLPKRRDRVCVH